MFLLAAAIVAVAGVRGSLLPLLFMVVPLSFSPRLVAEDLLFLGKVRRNQ